LQLQQKLSKFDFSLFSLFYAKFLSLLEFRFQLHLSSFEFSLVDNRNRELLFGQLLNVQVGGRFMDANVVQLSVQVGEIQVGFWLGIGNLILKIVS
jgi:hypothetical protein